jgi:hypothetical protein
MWLPATPFHGTANVDYPSANFQSLIQAPSLQKVFVFGGKSNGYSNKLFECSLDPDQLQWTKVEAKGTPPSPRYGQRYHTYISLSDENVLEIVLQHCRSRQGIS